LKIFDSIEQKTMGRAMMRATKLWLSDQREGREGQVWWIVETAPNVRITGRLLFTETAADFSG
jgi:hypothetical protein